MTAAGSLLAVTSGSRVQLLRSRLPYAEPVSTTHHASGMGAVTCSPVFAVCGRIRPPCDTRGCHGRLFGVHVEPNATSRRSSTTHCPRTFHEPSTSREPPFSICMTTTTGYCLPQRPPSAPFLKPFPHFSNLKPLARISPRACLQTVFLLTICLPQSSSKKPKGSATQAESDTASSAPRSGAVQ